VPIALVATGGTIAWHEGRTDLLSGAELAELAPCAFDEIVDVAAKPSWDLSISDMETIAGAVRDAIDRGAEGVVVTHGTDTIEESAWLTELTLGSDRRRGASVVFTGAMRFADVEGSDGPRNLTHAVRLLDGDAGQGVQVAFAERVHAARWVVKTDALALDAFESFGHPPSAPAPPKSSGRLEPAVALLKVGPAATPSIPADVRGVVLEGTGTGRVPSVYHEPVRQLNAEGVPVVLASRSRAARRMPTSDGVLRAGDLTAEKAAIALMVGLGSTSNIDSLRRWWTELLS
jgi:L-asparaginase